MAFSVTRLMSRAECVAYRIRKQKERAAVVARKSAIEVQLAAWDNGGDPVAKLQDVQQSITTMTPLVAAMTEGASKRKLENMLNSLKSTANNLTNRAETHGADDLLDKEQDLEEANSDLTIIDRLLGEVQDRHDQLTV